MKVRLCSKPHKLGTWVHANRLKLCTDRVGFSESSDGTTLPFTSSSEEESETEHELETDAGKGALERQRQSQPLIGDRSSDSAPVGEVGYRLRRRRNLGPTAVWYLRGHNR